MRLIYLSILTIALSFSMNTFAENPKVNMYFMDRTEQAKHYVKPNRTKVLCVEGYMFLVRGHPSGGDSVVQMREAVGRMMTCPLVYKE